MGKDLWYHLESLLYTATYRSAVFVQKKGFNTTVRTEITGTATKLETKTGVMPSLNPCHVLRSIYVKLLVFKSTSYGTHCIFLALIVVTKSQKLWVFCRIIFEVLFFQVGYFVILSSVSVKWGKGRCWVIVSILDLGFV